MVREGHSVLNRRQSEAPPEEYFPFKTEGGASSKKRRLLKRQCPGEEVIF
jgi:hypothetical protein